MDLGQCEFEEMNCKDFVGREPRTMGVQRNDLQGFHRMRTYPTYILTTFHRREQGDTQKIPLEVHCEDDRDRQECCQQEKMIAGLAGENK